MISDDYKERWVRQQRQIGALANIHTIQIENTKSHNDPVIKYSTSEDWTKMHIILSYLITWIL